MPDFSTRDACPTKISQKYTEVLVALISTYDIHFEIEVHLIEIEVHLTFPFLLGPVLNRSRPDQEF
jgi:hypothetical protein